MLNCQTFPCLHRIAKACLLWIQSWVQDLADYSEFKSSDLSFNFIPKSYLNRHKTFELLSQPVNQMANSVICIPPKILFGMPGEMSINVGVALSFLRPSLTGWFVFTIRWFFSIGNPDSCLPQILIWNSFWKIYIIS